MNPVDISWKYKNSVCTTSTLNCEKMIKMNHQTANRMQRYSVHTLEIAKNAYFCIFDLFFEFFFFIETIYMFFTFNLFVWGQFANDNDASFDHFINDFKAIFNAIYSNWGTNKTKKKYLCHFNLFKCILCRTRTLIIKPLNLWIFYWIVEFFVLFLWVERTKKTNYLKNNYFVK